MNDDFCLRSFDDNLAKAAIVAGLRGRERCDRHGRDRERLEHFVHREVSLGLVASTLCRYPFIGGSASWSLRPRPGNCSSAPNICSSLPNCGAWAALITR